MVEDASCVWDCNSNECEMSFKASLWKSSVFLQTPLCKAYAYHSHLVYSYTTQYSRMSHAQVCGVSVSPSRLLWNINTTSDRPGIQSALVTVDFKKAMVQQKNASHFKELQPNLLFHGILSAEVAARLRLRHILTFTALKVGITVEHQIVLLDSPTNTPTKKGSMRFRISLWPVPALGPVLPFLNHAINHHTCRSSETHYCGKSSCSQHSSSHSCACHCGTSSDSVAQS